MSKAFYYNNICKAIGGRGFETIALDKREYALNKPIKKVTFNENPQILNPTNPSAAPTPLPQIKAQPTPVTTQGAATPSKFNFGATQTIPPTAKPDEKSKDDRKAAKPVSAKKRKHIEQEMQKESDLIAKQLSKGELVNWYENIENKYLPKRRQYKNYDQILIDIPFQALIVGATGSGKTNAFRSLLKAINFKKVFICAKNLDEPLYKSLIDEYRTLGEQLNKQMIWTYGSLDELPDVLQFRDLLKNEAGILVCDDFVTEDKKKLISKVGPLISQGRKAGDGGLSVAFITQGYHETPIFFRKNNKLILLGTVTGNKDFNRIVSEYTLDIQPEQLQHLHKQIQQENSMNFLTVDLTKTKRNEIGLKYRKNFEVPAQYKQIIQENKKRKKEGDSIQNKRIKSIHNNSDSDDSDNNE